MPCSPAISKTATVTTRPQSLKLCEVLSHGEGADLRIDGINIEDSARGRLVEPSALVGKVSAIKEGFPDLFVNARIDTYWTGQDSLGDTLERMRRYVDAGADGIFVPGDLDLAVVKPIVDASPLPVNVLASPRYSRGQFAEVGVARISTGSLLYRAAISAAAQSLSGLREDRPAQTANVLTYRTVSSVDYHRSVLVHVLVFGQHLITGTIPQIGRGG